MSYAVVSSAERRSKSSTMLGSVVRVLITALLCTAGGMGAGLFLGIVGTVVYGMIKGGPIDMTNAYRHIAIPLALVAGSVALVATTVLEVRSRTRTSL